MYINLGFLQPFFTIAIFIGLPCYGIKLLIDYFRHKK